jgi:cytochrome P450
MTILITVLEIAFLTLVSRPLLRLVADKRMRRLFPAIHRALVGGVVLWLLAMVGLAWWLPGWLHALAIVGALVSLAAWWGGRPAYGRSRGLPPGSLSLSTSVEAILDREFYLERAARHGPVFKMRQFHRSVVCIVGLARSHQFLRENQATLRPPPLPFNREAHRGFLRYMDDATHAHYAPLFRHALASDLIEQARSVTTAVTRAELTHLGGTDPSVRHPDGLMNRITLVAFQRSLFGVNPGSVDFEQISSAFEPLDRHPSSRRFGRRQKAAMDELRALLTTLAERRSSLPDCVLRRLGDLAEDQPDTTSIDNLIILLKLTKGNVVGLMRWLLVLLGTHPEWIGRLRAELDARKIPEPSPMTGRIILETLRLAQSEYLFRRLEQPATINGFELPRGWLVRVCVWESHRSSEQFEDPNRFDPDRFLGRAYPPTAYSPLGTGPHACNGAPLTNLVCSVFIEELTRSWRWSVRHHEPAVHGFRHWDHWRPNPRLELVLRPLQIPRP